MAPSSNMLTHDAAPAALADSHSGHSMGLEKLPCEGPSLLPMTSQIVKGPHKCAAQADLVPPLLLAGFGYQEGKEINTMLIIPVLLFFTIMLWWYLKHF